MTNNVPKNPNLSSFNNPLVCIVIPTWNRCKDLQECLHSVYQMVYSNIKVIVVDNCSNDETAQMVNDLFPNVHFIQLSQNTGAAYAANIGFAVAKQYQDKYVLRLDSDTVLDEKFLNHLVEEAESDDRIGIVVGKIYYCEQKSRIWSMGAQRTWWNLGAKELARGQEDGPAYQLKQDIDYGWCTGMLITRHILQLTGGFDTDFVVYYEEADLCCRVQALGLRIRSVPSAHMWHKIGQTSRNDWVAYQWSRSKMLFFCKNSRGLHKIFLIFYAYVYAIVRGTVWSKNVDGNRGNLLTALKGLTSGLSYYLGLSKFG